MEEVWINIASQGPLVGILAWVVWYFKGKVKDLEMVIIGKDLEIKELNEVIRDDAKEGIKVMQAMTDVLKSVERKIEK